MGRVLNEGEFPSDARAGITRPGCTDSDDALLKAEALREEFPILHRRIRGRPLVYLDNAATTQKPRRVLDAVQQYYQHYNANVHRGVHLLSQEATEAYEGARRKVQRFIGARDASEVVYVRGATEAINLVAQSFARPRLGIGKEILVTAMEHHSNIVPWQLVCEQTGASLRVVPMNERGELLIDQVPKLLSDRTVLFGLVHVSNVLGTVNPVKQLIELSHSRGVPVLVDAAQSAAHVRVDVEQLDVDFLVISGHKMYGPMGIGILYGKRGWLEEMPPYQGGGDMIASVTFERTVYNDLPFKFEAGTPNVAGAVGLGAATDFLLDVGIASIADWEAELLEYAERRLCEIPDVRIFGRAAHKAAVLSFLVEGIHPHDLGTILDQQGVAIRTGHHCAQPVMEFFGIPATARASLGLYNTKGDIDALMDGVLVAREVFK
ncbi:MAG TPA: cysteine desulfurase [Acidobacteriota bacterium]|nr:cysteine desulfurase [Acidobacteriota bacterium]